MLRRTVACPPAERLEAAEALLVAGTSGDDAQHIEAHSLAQRPEDSSKDRAAAHRRLELTNTARGGGVYGDPHGAFEEHKKLLQQEAHRNSGAKHHRRRVSSTPESSEAHAPALADDDGVTLTAAEAWAEVRTDVGVTLLIPGGGAGVSCVFVGVLGVHTAHMEQQGPSQQHSWHKPQRAPERAQLCLFVQAGDHHPSTAAAGHASPLSLPTLQLRSLLCSLYCATVLFVRFSSVVTPAILLDVVQVVAAHNDCACHLCALHHACRGTDGQHLCSARWQAGPACVLTAAL